MYYFIYSQTQHRRQEDIYKKSGRSYIPGKVAVNGKIELFTSTTKDVNSIKILFSDAKVVKAVESLSDVNYTNPSFNKVRRIV